MTVLAVLAVIDRNNAVGSHVNAGKVKITSSFRLLAHARRYREGDVAAPDSFDAAVAHLSESFDCCNCSVAVERVARMATPMYCSANNSYCRQFASLVRRFREIVDEDNPDDDELVSLSIKLDYIYSGYGYPTRDRYVSDKLRKEIFTRDNQTCKLCGKPATEIDHIRGNSSDPSNLQAVCRNCNINKRPAARPASPEEFARIRVIHRELVKRCGSITPIRACDDESRWKKVWNAVNKARNARQRKIMNCLSRFRDLYDLETKGGTIRTELSDLLKQEIDKLVNG
ncbi:MAG: HNH endonuclease [Capsulimonadaceae bacterium]